MNDSLNLARVARWSLPLVLSAALVGSLAGCSSGSGGSGMANDPITDLRNPRKSIDDRMEAVDRAWTAYAPDSPARKAARESLKSLLWSQQTDERMRVKIVRTLLSDTDPAGLEDTRQMFKLLLPPERSRAIVAEICKGAAANGWADLTPSLIRAYAAEVPRISEDKRPERLALEELNPGQPVEQTVFKTFLNPPKQDAIYGMDFQERLRTDAWNLLARLDGDGEIRVGLMSALGNAASADATDPVLADLQAGLRDLRVIPITGDELKWLRSLRDPKKTANAERWRETAGIVAGLDRERTGAISIRHLEPIRWASKNRPEWLQKSKDELFAISTERLSGRNTNKRSDDDSGSLRQVSEDINVSRQLLRWGDLLTILVLLDAVDDPGVRASMFRLAVLDRKDTTTEYGGLLRAAASGEQGGFVAVLYPPRPAQRVSDREFIASDDLIAASDWALSIFHFHAQREGNREYAGPSAADIEFARRSRRTCIVVTSLDKGRMGVDFYQAAGAVVDLGEISEPEVNGK